VEKNIPKDAPIYTLDWYAPAMGYYGDREWRLLSRNARATKVIGAVDILSEPERVTTVPPWPKDEFHVACDKEVLAESPLIIKEVLASVDNYRLVRVLKQ